MLTARSHALLMLHRSSLRTGKISGSESKCAIWVRLSCAEVTYKARTLHLLGFARREASIS